MRTTKEQVVIGSNFCQRKGVGLRVVVEAMKELIDISGVFLVAEVCLWIIGDCLTTSRKLDSTDKKRSA